MSDFYRIHNLIGVANGIPGFVGQLSGETTSSGKLSYFKVRITGRCFLTSNLVKVNKPPIQLLDNIILNINIPICLKAISLGHSPIFNRLTLNTCRTYKLAVYLSEKKL